MDKVSLLLCEDDIEVIQSLKIALDELQYTLLNVFQNGESALEFLSQAAPDVILMEINLPGELNGIKTAQVIQQKYDIPIIFLAAHKDIDILSRALKNIPSAYLLVPYAKDELRIAIELAYNKHQIEKKLKNSEKKYRTLHDKMKQGVVYQNSEGKIISVNPAAEKILGFTEDEIVTLTFESLSCDTIKEDGSPFPGNEHPAMEALRTGKTINNVVMGLINNHENTLKWIKIDAYPLFADEELQPHQVCTIFEDITDQKLKEEQLIEARDNAEKSDRLKTEFLAQMSHEIRTPINNIITFINLLREEFEDKLPDELHSSFQILDNSSKRLIRTIELILNMSKIQTGNFETKFEKFDLIKDILDDIVMEFFSRAHDKGLELQFEKAANNSMIYGDRYSVGQIFMNLIGNALKYTEKGFIRIIAKNTENNLIIQVEDSGRGISEEYLPKLFQPFTQEDSGYARRFEGTGLGLSLVKKYAEINSASIDVKSKQGEGTVFTVKFTAL